VQDPCRPGGSPHDVIIIRVPRAFLIDTDTASDDAVALIMALRAPDVAVRAITIVAGNVPVAQATRNALYTAELCGSDVPVYAGVQHPLVREHMHAEWFHGKDGLGDHSYPAPRREPEPTHAVEVSSKPFTPIRALRWSHSAR
jgi:purine nucleosidase